MRCGAKRLAEVLCCLMLINISSCTSASSGSATSTRVEAPDVSSGGEVYAIQYGTLSDFPVASLVAGADTSRRLDAALMVWLIRRGDGRNVLVDAGFYRDKFVNRWKPTNYVRPSDALLGIGIPPDSITDIIVTHVHWDHMDGVDLFPKARVWIQREEFEHHISPDGRVLDRTVDSLDAAMMGSIATGGRVRLVEGGGVEIIPGIRVFTGGKHTFASQYVAVTTAAGTVVLASDNAYLYENLDNKLPIAQTLDAASNLDAQARMKELATSPRLIIPGHDPQVMTRFPLSGPHVVRIR